MHAGTVPGSSRSGARERKRAEAIGRDQEVIWSNFGLV